MRSCVRPVVSRNIGRTTSPLRWAFDCHHCSRAADQILDPLRRLKDDRRAADDVLTLECERATDILSVKSVERRRTISGQATNRRSRIAPMLRCLRKRLSIQGRLRYRTLDSVLVAIIIKTMNTIAFVMMCRPKSTRL